VPRLKGGGMIYRQMSFSQWLTQVGEWLEQMPQTQGRGLPDRPYEKWYETNVSPLSAATRATRVSEAPDG